MSEGDLMREIQLASSEIGARLFRNNSAQGWVGKSQHIGGRILIDDPRPLHAGLCVGSSDLIGWTPTLTESGPVAIFTAVEVKSHKGRLTVDQSRFLDAVRSAGGIGVCVKSVDEAIQAIKGMPRA